MPTLNSIFASSPDRISLALFSPATVEGSPKWNQLETPTQGKLARHSCLFFLMYCRQHCHGNKRGAWHLTRWNVSGHCCFEATYFLLFFTTSMSLSHSHFDKKFTKGPGRLNAVDPSRIVRSATWRTTMVQWHQFNEGDCLHPFSNNLELTTHMERGRSRMHRSKGEEREKR